MIYPHFQVRTDVLATLLMIPQELTTEYQPSVLIKLTPSILPHHVRCSTIKDVVN